MSKKATDRKTLSPVPLRGQGCTTSSIRERQDNKSDSRRRRRRNPFSERHRNNFPDINDVFKSTASSSSSDLIHGNSEYDDLPKNIFDDDGDEGCCQYSDIDNSSVLNMSIGARAALNEHARYVAKYGIDGEKDGEAESNNKSNYSDEIDSEIRTNLFLDEQWEKLLDLSRVASSLGGSVSEGIPSPPNSTTINLHFDNSNTEKSGYEELSSIEVMTDVSHDFFNSSRVNSLITPERNKNRGSQMVMTRDRGGVDDTPLHGRLGSSFGENDLDIQTSSFNIGDVSRISNNTVSDSNSTPDASFQNYQKKDIRIDVDDDKKNYDDGYGFSTIFGAGSPPGILKDSSILLPTSAAALPRLPSSNNDKQRSFSSSSGTRGRTHEKEDVPAPRNRIMSTESASQEESVHSSSIQSAVSTFIAEARTFARQVASDVEKSIEGMESLTEDFLRGMELGQTDAPSPISQVLSSPSTSRQGGSTNEQQQLEKSLNIETHSSRSKSSGSLASSVVGDALQIHLTGRQRYRTVVPRRVYLDLPSQQFYEEQDSFVAIQSNPETTRAGVSLLDSFNEVAKNNTF